MKQPSDASSDLVHATAVLVGDRGVLIMGPSGAGKSALARALVDRALARNSYAALVSDDQCHLQQLSGRLVCSAPPTLEGGLEVRGSGLHAVDHEPEAVIHLAVDFVEATHAVRYGGNQMLQLEGVAIQHLIVPKREIEAACRAVEARLQHPVWDKIHK